MKNFFLFIIYVCLFCFGCQYQKKIDPCHQAISGIKFITADLQRLKIDSTTSTFWHSTRTLKAYYEDNESRQVKYLEVNVKDHIYGGSYKEEYFFIGENYYALREVYPDTLLIYFIFYKKNNDSKIYYCRIKNKSVVIDTISQQAIIDSKISSYSYVLDVYSFLMQDLRFGFIDPIGGTIPTVETTVDSLPLFSKSNLNAPIIKRLPKSEDLIYLGNKRNILKSETKYWFKVAINYKGNLTGWIHCRIEDLKPFTDGD